MTLSTGDDLVVEFLRLGRGLKAQLVVQNATQLVIHGECLTAPSGTVQCLHEPNVKRLVQMMGGHQ
jgi:hypothetical protein